MNPQELFAEALMSDAVDEPVGIVELFTRPDWMRDGLCQEHPDVSWFPDRGQPTEPAKALCRQCLVRYECLDYALEEGISHGIWGGESERGRKVLRRTLKAA